VNIAAHAFLWQGGVMVHLGTPGGSGPNDGPSGLDVSDNGQVGLVLPIQRIKLPVSAG
jgi:hypothetical protein